MDDRSDFNFIAEQANDTSVLDRLSTLVTDNVVVMRGDSLNPAVAHSDVDWNQIAQLLNADATSADQQVLLLTFIGRFGGSDQIPVAAQFLTDNNQDYAVREQAIAALVGIAGDDAMQVLAEFRKTHETQNNISEDLNALLFSVQAAYEELRNDGVIDLSLAGAPDPVVPSGSRRTRNVYNPYHTGSAEELIRELSSSDPEGHKQRACLFGLALN